MGALATTKSTHVSTVVPMTGFAFCTVFSFYVLWDERYNRNNTLPSLPSSAAQELQNNTMSNPEGRGAAEGKEGDVPIDMKSNGKSRNSDSKLETWQEAIKHGTIVLVSEIKDSS